MQRYDKMAAGPIEWRLPAWKISMVKSTQQIFYKKQQIGWI